jgi:RNA polymerase sigma-70 factor (ECF subfamily)
VIALRASSIGRTWRAPDQTEQARLVAELRDGSLAALATAYDRWHQRLRVLARRLSGDDAAAEDVVQEVFERLPHAVKRFRGDVDLETFLLAIAVKRSRQHLRAALRRRHALGGFALHERSGPGDPERHAYRRQLAARLAEALDGLPAEQREAFVLCEVEGLTSAQVSRVAGIPETTVRTRLFHARRRLRASLAGERAE